MALYLSHFPHSSSSTFSTSQTKKLLPKLSSQTKPNSSNFPGFLSIAKTNPKKHRFITINAIEQNGKETTENTTESEIGSATQIPFTEAADNSSSDSGAGGDEVDLGLEIRKAMKEREEKGEGFWSGVVGEIGEIEWPAFNKVLGTTGVVIGVIGGSSVVLLTLNAVLAELSDRVFGGKGVQDFFG